MHAENTALQREAKKQTWVLAKGKKNQHHQFNKKVENAENGIRKLLNVLSHFWIACFYVKCATVFRPNFFPEWQDTWY